MRESNCYTIQFSGCVIRRIFERSIGRQKVLSVLSNGEVIAEYPEDPPYKTPLLLADTGAVLTPMQFDDRLFTGAGLGGDGSLSNALPETVHQGYAPVIAIHLPQQESAA